MQAMKGWQKLFGALPLFLKDRRSLVLRELMAVSATEMPPSPCPTIEMLTCSLRLFGLRSASVLLTGAWAWFMDKQRAESIPNKQF